MYKSITLLNFFIITLIMQLSAQAESPRPEHPMPQMQRDQWINLNGQWDFAETDEDDDSWLTKAEWPDEITVPFARESELSGLGRTHFVNNVWYRRNFTVPDNWRENKTLLHIGASDWITRVWVNGQFIGDHVGGYAAFSFDITDELNEGENTVIIHAYDNERSGLQPLGKQSRRAESHGIFYTRTTGVWQTVWLENVGTSYIKDFKVIPDPDQQQLQLQADLEGSTQGLELVVEAFAEGEKVGTANINADWRYNFLTIDLSKKHLWSVENPFLYDLKLRLVKDGEVIDEVHSYFGLRKIAIEGKAILINDEPVFQRLVLDQGFYPDGIWTAPTDEALKKDIELSKEVGFNGARLHQKVFEPRFLYWADKLGYLVWGEFPSYGADYDNPAVNHSWIEHWVEVVRRDRNHPSIIGWCPFNETPSDAGELQHTVLRLTRTIDPTRPVIETSGWVHSFPNPEVMDAHDYNQDPESFRQKWMDYFENSPLPARYHGTERHPIPFFVSEFGGIGWFEKDDGTSWGYGNMPETLDEFYERFEGLTTALLDNPHMFGYCYTQLTDIEQEKNGIFNYDRSAKFDSQKLYEIQTQTAAYEKNPPLKIKQTKHEFDVLVAGAPDGKELNQWQYTIEQPAESWYQINFDDTKWKTGHGGFGTKDGSEKWINTPWNTDDIWLRKTFTYSEQMFEHAYLVIHYDNATKIYLNGEEIWQRDRWNDQYAAFEITEQLKSTLKEGENTLAVHCHQDDGGQFIDLAILLNKN